MHIMAIGDRWFSRQRIDDAVWLLISLRQVLSDLAGADVLAVATHGHFGHVGGLFEFYDDGLIDELPGSEVETYVATMHRLRTLPTEVVHGNHEPSLGRGRMLELIDSYLRRPSRIAA